MESADFVQILTKAICTSLRTHPVGKGMNLSEFAGKTRKKANNQVCLGRNWDRFFFLAVDTKLLLLLIPINLSINLFIVHGIPFVTNPFIYLYLNPRNLWRFLSLNYLNTVLWCVYEKRILSILTRFIFTVVFFIWIFNLHHFLSFVLSFFLSLYLFLCCTRISFFLSFFLSCT